MKEKVLKPGIDQAVFVIVAVAGLTTLTFLMTQGTTISEAKGTCYTEVKTCKGLPFNGSCIGSVEVENNFDSAEECSQISEIEASCSSVRSRLCASSEYSGDQWKEAVVNDFSCSTWEEQYSSIDLKSCNPNN
jgi:hypothetical protein